MDPQKLDGGLLGELESADQGRYTVLVRTKSNLSRESQQQLRQFGAAEDPARSRVFSLDLDRAQVETLSDKDWVMSIRLSRKLRPLRS